MSIKGSKGARLQVGLASRAFVDEESLLGHAAQTLGLYILASERVKRSESKAGNLDDTCDSPRAPHRKQPMFLFFWSSGTGRNWFYSRSVCEFVWRGGWPMSHRVTLCHLQMYHEVCVLASTGRGPNEMFSPIAKKFPDSGDQIAAGGKQPTVSLGALPNGCKKSTSVFSAMGFQSARRGNAEHSRPPRAVRCAARVHA